MAERIYAGYRLVPREGQDSVTLFVFSARVKDVKMWAGIRSIEKVEKGTQRVLRPTRVNAIKRFLAADPSNCIPNSVLLAFLPGVASFQEVVSEDFTEDNGCGGLLTWGRLRFTYDPDSPEHQKPALIVDGQHRIYGLAAAEPEDAPIIVVALVDADYQEQAFQFIVINNKATRVPSENVKAIIADFDEEALRVRLLRSGVRYGDSSPILIEVDELEESPFRALLDWPRNREGKRLVPLTAIEQSVRYWHTLFPNLQEDADSLLEIFLAVWRAVRARYDTLWGDDNQLMTKVSLNALNEFLADRLKLAWHLGFCELFETSEVEKSATQMIERIPPDFWSTPWGIRIQDNANVRGLIKGDLERVTDNVKLQNRWDSDLSVLQGGNPDS